MLEYVLAAVMPLFFMMFFNRVLFTKYLPLAITIVILIIGFDGLQRTVPVQIIGALSTLAGFVLGLKIHSKQNRKVR
jgi:general stress protein CsbA